MDRQPRHPTTYKQLQLRATTVLTHKMCWASLPGLNRLCGNHTVNYKPIRIPATTPEWQQPHIDMGGHCDERVEHNNRHDCGANIATRGLHVHPTTVGDVCHHDKVQPSITCFWTEDSDGTPPPQVRTTSCPGIDVD